MSQSDLLKMFTQMTTASSTYISRNGANKKALQM